MHEIPVDVLANSIFVHLSDSLTDLLSCALVCSTWHSAQQSNHFWEQCFATLYSAPLTEKTILHYSTAFRQSKHESLYESKESCVQLGFEADFYATFLNGGDAVQQKRELESWLFSGCEPAIRERVNDGKCLLWKALFLDAANHMRFIPPLNYTVDTHSRYLSTASEANSTGQSAQVLISNCGRYFTHNKCESGDITSVIGKPIRYKTGAHYWEIQVINSSFENGFGNITIGLELGSTELPIASQPFKLFTDEGAWAHYCYDGDQRVSGSYIKCKRISCDMHEIIGVYFDSDSLHVSFYKNRELHSSCDISEELTASPSIHRLNINSLTQRRLMDEFIAGRIVFYPAVSHLYSGNTVLLRSLSTKLFVPQSLHDS